MLPSTSKYLRKKISVKISSFINQVECIIFGFLQINHVRHEKHLCICRVLTTLQIYLWDPSVINPCQIKGCFIYPLSTSEKLLFFVLREYKKGKISFVLRCLQRV